MSKLMYDTENMLNLFNDNKSYILHIPHSSTFIPNTIGFISNEAIQKEIELLTDHCTDTIFNLPNVTKLVTPFSRIFCDVERLPDNDEPMYKCGRGFYYTHADNGEELRVLDNTCKDFVYKNYYKKHHQKLEKLVKNKLNKYGKAVIIDCHSFSDAPFKTDLIQDTERPDFCIGTDNYHTPQYLIDLVVNGLKSFGYTVGINNPYAGTIVPLKYYGINDNVQSIMIEVNRKLYIDNGIVNTEKVNRLNEVLLMIM